jgi:hypothetical protein
LGKDPKCVFLISSQVIVVLLVQVPSLRITGLELERDFALEIIAYE